MSNEEKGKREKRKDAQFNLQVSQAKDNPIVI